MLNSFGPNQLTVLQSAFSSLPSTALCTKAVLFCFILYSLSVSTLLLDLMRFYSIHLPQSLQTSLICSQRTAFKTTPNREKYPVLLHIDVGLHNRSCCPRFQISNSQAVVIICSWTVVNVSAKKTVQYSYLKFLLDVLKWMIFVR